VGCCAVASLPPTSPRSTSHVFLPSGAPVTVGTERYVDGGVHAPTNADLLEHCYGLDAAVAAQLAIGPLDDRNVVAVIGESFLGADEWLHQHAARDALATICA